MKRSIIYPLAVLCLLAKPSLGQETLGMTFADFQAHSEKNSFRQQMIKAKLQMIDINNDGKISYNEINKERESARNINIGFVKLDDLKEEVLETFQKNDKNNDNELSADEVNNFTSQMYDFLLKKSFMSLDVNNDGIYDENDATSPEFMEQMHEAIEDIKKQDFMDFKQSMVQSLAAVADEDYYQMDKDHDNCVTEKDYDTYISQKDEDEYESLEQIYMDIDYSEIDKEKRDCLTKEEYIKQITMRFLEPKKWAEDIVPHTHENDYDQMDKNQDSCVTRDEYIEYSQKENENSDTKWIYSDYVRDYIKFKKENKNCLTKEEYIAYWDRFSEDFSLENIGKIDLEIEKEYAEAIFEYIDKDSNGQLTAEEYVEYEYEKDVKLFAPKEPLMKEMHYENFSKGTAPDKNWMNKEEFVEYSVKQAERIEKMEQENTAKILQEMKN